MIGNGGFFAMGAGQAAAFAFGGIGGVLPRPATVTPRRGRRSPPVMRSETPHTLHHLLAELTSSTPSELLRGPAGAALELTLRRMAALHDTVSERGAGMTSGSLATKRQLIDRVYGSLVDALPEHVRYQTVEFIDAYMEQDCELVHGELYARHVGLADGGNSVCITASPHHWGEGTYDLGSLAADLCVPLCRGGQPLEPLLNWVWYRYRRLRRMPSRGDELSFRVHLVLHLMRRLLGFEPVPGTLGRAETIGGRQFCLDELVRWLR